MKSWTRDSILSQKGKLAIVTGSTGGIGYETARALSASGAEVILAARNPEKGAGAVARIRREIPDAAIQFEEVDLASLESVTDFGTRLRSQRKSLDLLINNAAVMNPPKRQETSDGLELQFATNYLSHFALTAHLMPLLCRGMNARVVTLSSIAARNGTINFEDLQAQRSYQPMRSYSQSKLACLMFAFELQRRCEAGGWCIASIAAHPGISRTDLLHNAPGRWSAAGMVRTLFWFLFQPASQGALPALFAATAPDAKAGAYYGPKGYAEMRGAPGMAAIPKQALDEEAAVRLWRVSERLTGLAISP